MFAEGSAAVPRRLAVGFAPLDEAVSVVAASSLPTGDGAFISRGARITVLGASGTSATPRDRRVVDLLAHYSYFDGAERKLAPFRAWSCNRATGCEGNRVSFNVPVDEEQRLTFTLETERGTPSAQASSRRDALTGAATQSAVTPVTLSLTSERDSLKLVRGYYVIVPMFDGDAEPEWSRYALRRDGARMAMVNAGGDVAPFEHLVLRIDYAPLP